MRKKFRKFSVPGRSVRQKRLRRLKILSRHPYAVPFITFGALLAITGLFYVAATTTHHLVVPPDAKIVVISHDRQQQIVPTREPTVGALLKKLNLQLNQGDVVEPAASTHIDQDQFRINIYRAVPVEIVDGTHHTFTFSAATTPRSIASQVGKTVYNDDIVTADPVQDFVKNGAIGEQIVINRATPVNLNLYGTPVLVRTHAPTVAALIRQKGIHLAKDDQVLPGEDAPLTPNIQVFIERNGTKIETVTEQIPMPIQTLEDPTLAYGTHAIRQQGAAGQRVTTYQDQLRNGVVIGRAVLQTVVTQDPVTEIVVEGTSLSGIKGDMALAGIAPSDYDYADYIVSHESGWCPTKAQGEHYCPAVPDDPMTPNGYGLCQATPGYKMATAGGDWQTNPVTQLRWCSGYAHARYGSWYAAYSHWLAYRNW